MVEGKRQDGIYAGTLRPWLAISCPETSLTNHMSKYKITNNFKTAPTENPLNTRTPECRKLCKSIDPITVKSAVLVGCMPGNRR